PRDAPPIETAIRRPRFRRGQPSSRWEAFVEAESVVQRQAGPEFEDPSDLAAEEWDQKCGGFPEMGHNPHQRLPLTQVEPDQPEIELLEIPQSAMDDARRR